MTADDPVCLCGDRRSEHRLGRRGCKALDCGCGEFDPADAMTVEFAEKSTSARLREVERELAEAREELDELRALRDAIPCAWCDGVGVAPAERFGRDADGAPIRDEDGPCPEGCAVAPWLQAERNDAADDLRIARAERDEWEARSRHFEQRAVDQLAATVQAQRAQTAEIHGWDAFQCFTCGSRYRRDFDHECGPLKPVRVSIHER